MLSSKARSSLAHCCIITSRQTLDPAVAYDKDAASCPSSFNTSSAASLECAFLCTMSLADCVRGLFVRTDAQKGYSPAMDATIAQPSW